MARASQPINVTPEERETLKSMLEYVDKTIADRIRIVLACAHEPNNKKVAVMLGTDEHKVAKWKEAFRENGISGLQSNGGAGRKPKSSMPKLEEALRHLLEEENSKWTIHALATKLGVTDYQVRTILRSKNISLCRKRQWSYQTLDCLSSADIEVMGLYISKEICFALTCFCQYGIRTLPGEYTTVNSDLAEKLDHIDYRLSLGDILMEIQHYQYSAITVQKPWSFLKDLLVTVSDDGIDSLKPSYHLFLWSKDEILRNTVFPIPAKLVVCQSPEDFLSKLHSWAGGLTSAAHLYEIERITECIRSYLHCTTNPEPFRWKKKVESIGNDSLPILYQPSEEVKPQTNIEQWFQQLMEGELSNEDLTSGMIAFVRDSDGFSFRIIKGEKMPDANQFAFDTEEGFLNGMNQLEKAVLKTRDKAGLETVDLYLDQVKKTKADRHYERIHCGVRAWQVFTNAVNSFYGLFPDEP